MKSQFLTKTDHSVASLATIKIYNQSTHIFTKNQYDFFITQSVIAQENLHSLENFKVLETACNDKSVKFIAVQIILPGHFCTFKWKEIFSYYMVFQSLFLKISEGNTKYTEESHTYL